MKKSNIFFVVTLLVLSLFGACSTNSTCVERSFYYWKNTDYNLRDAELARIKALGTQKLYVKFFEVEADELIKARPTAKMDLHLYDLVNSYNPIKDSLLDSLVSYMEVIPTVYIRNEVFYNISKSELDTLAVNILFLCQKYYKSNIRNRHVDFKELQIDCDWTNQTKDNYFYLLEQIKQQSGKKLSCTLRLYPYKYPDKMGVPPVDKVTLMCYNLINPIENKDENSLQNNGLLEAYLKKAAPYPIHLDIALPVFSWIHVYQNNQFVGMISADKINLKEYAKQLKPMWYELEKDIEVGDLYLRIGDKLKLEEFEETETLKTISLLKKYISFDDTTTITLFHLDNENLEKYNNEVYNRFYSTFAN
jgi:hypothetical protein